jgi:hypothetical protein
VIFGMALPTALRPCVAPLMPLALQREPKISRHRSSGSEKSITFADLDDFS